MSTQPIQYGIREFDLSESRNLQRVNIRAENIAVLRADDTAELRINTQDAAPINPRELSGITVPSDDESPGIERLYISNESGTGLLRLLVGFGGTAGVTDPPSGTEVDVTNREARQLGKARIMDSGGVLVDPPDASLFSNQSSLTSFTVSSDGALPSNDVPNGIEVVLIADPGNNDIVTVDGAVPMSAGSSLSYRVTNTDAISVTFADATDEIAVTFEG